MTPEQLEEIRNRAIQWRSVNKAYLIKPEESLGLLDYIDTLHEDLRLTRQERDQEKHKNLALRKDNALLHRALEAVEGYVGRLEHELAALRRGQGTAPYPRGPGNVAFHETHPIPDSTKGDV